MIMRFNTTPNWQDPFNPPDPSDPLFWEWAAANPNSRVPNDPRGVGFDGQFTPGGTAAPAPQPGGNQNPGPGGGPPQTPTNGPTDGRQIPPNSPVPDWLPNPPTFNGPGINKPPAFYYEDFRAPTQQEVFNDPGYQFGLTQGLGALTNSKAAQGILGTGGSLKDFINYGTDYANQYYGNIYNRDLQTYAMNRSNALDTYNTNYQTQYRDPWTEQFQTSQASLQPQLLGYQTTVNAGLQNDAQNRLYNFNQQVFDYNKQRNTQLDAFDEWYKKFLLQLQSAGM